MNVRNMCSTSELPDSTVLEYPGAKVADGLVLKGPWKQHAAPLGVIIIFGLMQCISQPPARPPNRRVDLQIGG